MNTVLHCIKQYYCKMKGVAISSCFLGKMSLYIGKRFYNLWYKPILCDALRDLSPSAQFKKH